MTRARFRANKPSVLETRPDPPTLAEAAGGQLEFPDLEVHLDHLDLLDNLDIKDLGVNLESLGHRAHQVVADSRDRQAHLAQKEMKVCLENLVLQDLSDLPVKVVVLEYLACRVLKDIVDSLDVKDQKASLDDKEKRVQWDLLVQQVLPDRRVHVDHQEIEVEMGLQECRAPEVRMVPQVTPEPPDPQDPLATLDFLELKVKRVMQDLMVPLATQAPQAPQEQTDHQVPQEVLEALA